MINETRNDRPIALPLESVQPLQQEGLNGVIGQLQNLQTEYKGNIELRDKKAKELAELKNNPLEQNRIKKLEEEIKSLDTTIASQKSELKNLYDHGVNIVKSTELSRNERELARKFLTQYGDQDSQAKIEALLLRRSQLASKATESA